MENTNRKYVVNDAVLELVSAAQRVIEASKISSARAVPRSSRFVGRATHTKRCSRHYATV